jgi:4'-phosphopantetheinyl transferase
VLERGEVAVWRFPAGASRPIEGVLARYVGVPSEEVVVRRTPAGKPEPEQTRFSVSLAHGGEVALVAVALDAQVGIDVEPFRKGIESWSLVSHALTPDEQARLTALPAAERGEAFLSAWTRKEALLKAVGVGLGVDPRLIELDGCTVVDVPPELGGTGDWTLLDVPVPGHVSALALRAPLSRLLLYDPPEWP